MLLVIEKCHSFGVQRVDAIVRRGFHPCLLSNAPLGLMHTSIAEWAPNAYCRTPLWGLCTHLVVIGWRGEIDRDALSPESAT